MDSKSDSLLIGGVSHSPAVELIQASEHHFIRSPNPSTDLNIETLNFQVSDEGTKKWYVASPDASEIFTLNLKDKTLKSLLKRNHARHIFQNNGQFFYSYEVKNSSISRLSEKNLSGKWSDLEVETFGNSPHLTRLTFT